MKSKTSPDTVSARVSKTDSVSENAEHSSRLAQDHSNRLAPDQSVKKPGTKLEFSPVRGPTAGRGGRNPSSGRGPNKRSSVQSITGSGASGGNPGPGRTPQTKRRELSLSSEKNSPSGSPRNTTRGSSPNVTSTKKTGKISEKYVKSSNVDREANATEEASRKSSNSSQDSGIGRENKPSRPRGKRPAPIRTGSPETSTVEVSNRKRFEELCDLKKVELGIVRVPPEILDELIHKEPMEKYYTIDEIPVASGLFATVRKCTNRETGIEYAAKFSSRIRCGQDCTIEILHEIALLSVCAESNKIVHLKDVFQNKHQIILVLEYAPGGDFQSVLDDDMVPFEQDVQGFLYQLLEALAFIHERKIAHLDIKPQNIVLMSEFPNCEIKLCDLEVSRVIQENEELKEIIGTPDYVAPEILLMEPITLAADIWSMGVLAYVLLTGFSPFGGDSDQETLRNITSAPLDFPPELFEGVSNEAKDFISACLDRDPRKRPTVTECLELSWIASNCEPPSPSPLMLKIPTPEHFVSTPKLSVHSPTGTARRSCQTCRDKIIERKRYLSKSREAIFEKVTNSALKKSMSKSRERLCDLRFTLSKSRDCLNTNESKIASRSQEKFYGFKSLSKSQEVLSAALGGNMKRMINGAVSDISHAHLPISPRVYLDTADSCDFVILPGSSVLMSHADLMSHSDLISGRSTPASLTLAIADIQLTDINNDHVQASSGTGGKVHETLVEEAEEECQDKPSDTGGDFNGELLNGFLKKNVENVQTKGHTSTVKSERRKSTSESSMTKISNIKEEKDNLNYETKQSMSSSASENNIDNKISTVDMGVQVNLIKCSSSPDIMRKENTGKEGNKRYDQAVKEPPKPKINIEDLAIRPTGKTLTRGFSHDDTLGEESKRYSWREELERFRSMKKPLRVSQLIDTFSNKPSEKITADASMPQLHALKNRRRGSLQIQIDSKSLAQLSETVEHEKNIQKAIKLQRRKSTSAIFPFRVPDHKLSNINTIKEIDRVTSKDNINNDEKKDIEKAVTEKNEEIYENDVFEENILSEERSSCSEPGSPSGVKQPGQWGPRGQVYLEKVHERKRTWDYFEINHPKAISDKKLQQLKAKYTRRKTDGNIQLHSNSKCEATKQIGKTSSQESLKSGKESPKTMSTHGAKTPPILNPQSRTMSMPIIEGVMGMLQPSRPLELAWDPFTGECLSMDSESVDSGRGSEIMRKSSTDSSEASSSRKSSRRKSSHLGDISESDNIIPHQFVLECFIDPFTGQFITNEVMKPVETNNNITNDKTKKKSRNLEVSIPFTGDGPRDDGIGSLPDTPTPTTGINIINNNPLARETDDGIFTSSEEIASDSVCYNIDSTDSVCGAIDAEKSVGDNIETVDFLCDNIKTVDSVDDNINATDSVCNNIDALDSLCDNIDAVSRVCTGSFSRGIERFLADSTNISPTGTGTPAGATSPIGITSPAGVGSPVSELRDILTENVSFGGARSPST